MQSRFNIEEVYRHARSVKHGTSKSQILAYSREYARAKQLAQGAIIRAEDPLASPAFPAPRSSVSKTIFNKLAEIPSRIFGDWLNPAMAAPAVLAIALIALLLSYDFYPDTSNEHRLVAQIADIGVQMPADSWGSISTTYTKSLDVAHTKAYSNNEYIQLGYNLAHISKFSGAEADQFINSLERQYQELTEPKLRNIYQEFILIDNKSKRSQSEYIQELMQKDHKVMLGYILQLASSERVMSGTLDMSTFMPMLKVASEAELGKTRADELFRAHQLNPNQSNQLELFNNLREEVKDLP